MFHGYGNYQEYIYQQLDPGEMQSGRTYQVSLKYTMCDAAQYTTDDLGIAFFSTPMSARADAVLGLFKDTEPQVRNPEGHWMNDAVNWSTLTGYYTASGNETYFGIGAFEVDATISLSPSLTDYFTHNERLVMYVDDVSIFPCPEVTLPDTLLCGPDDVELNASYPGATYLWSTGETTATIHVGEEAGSYWVDISASGCTIREHVQIAMFDP